MRMRKNEDVVIYQDERFYASFPSVVVSPEGQLVLAFRRAPNRRLFGAKGYTHADPNSYLVLVRSDDQGKTWSDQPEHIFAHPLGGSQDPCMVMLRNGTIVLTSYAWTVVPEYEARKADRVLRVFDSWAFLPLGGYLLRSRDLGGSWEGPFIPPEFENDTRWIDYVPRPALNRGAMVQGSDDVLYWAVVRTPQELQHTMLELLVSKDEGETWEHRSTIASHETAAINETSLVETVDGQLVGFARTAQFGDHGMIIRSPDRGMTWEWEDSDVVGHPYHALRLPDDRIYVVYGYRHEPYGIRARIWDPSCRECGEELVLRDDGCNHDLGYPWSCLTADGRVLSVYYINHNDETRYIAGTFVDLS